MNETVHCVLNFAYFKYYLKFVKKIQKFVEKSYIYLESCHLIL